MGRFCCFIPKQLKVQISRLNNGAVFPGGTEDHISHAKNSENLSQNNKKNELKCTRGQLGSKPFNCMFSLLSRQF